MLHSFSPFTIHSTHWIFRCLVNLFFVQFVLNACSCAAQIVASVSTFGSLCTNHFQDKSLSISSGILRTNCSYILFLCHLILNSFWLFFLNKIFSFDNTNYFYAFEKYFIRFTRVQTQIVLTGSYTLCLH